MAVRRNTVTEMNIGLCICSTSQAIGLEARQRKRDDMRATARSSKAEPEIEKRPSAMARGARHNVRTTSYVLHAARLTRLLDHVLDCYVDLHAT